MYLPYQLGQEVIDNQSFYLEPREKNEIHSTLAQH